MSDFLSGLLARSLGGPPALRRRRPGLFEPQSDQAPPGEITEMEETVYAPDSSDRPVTPAHRDPWHEPAPPAAEEHGGALPTSRPAWTRRFDQPDSDSAAPDLRALETIVAAQVDRSFLRFRDAVGREHRQPTEATPSFNDPGPGRTAARAESADTSAAQLRRGETGTERHRTAPPAPRPRASIRVEREVRIERTAALPPEKPPATRRESVTPTTAPPREPAAVTRARAQAVPQRRARPGPAPVNAPVAPLTDAAPVRVTIGRVEVRANVGPPPPVRRAVRAKPSLTLEEYLRTRNGGQR